MSTYIFIHGKNPSLSAYELQSIYENKIKFQNELFSVVDTECLIDQNTMDSLGGTVKICKVFSEKPEDMILQSSKSEKVIFGLSQYGGHERLSDVLISLKKIIIGKGRNARFLNKNFSSITTGQLNKSKLIKKGVDLIRCFYQGQEVWAKTIFFQNIDAYSERDYNKPKRDMKVGMMPPKLCQMMINFSKAKSDSFIYDPFVGLGGVLMEATLMGYNVVGSDIKGRLIDSTIKNLKWLAQQYVDIKSFYDESNFFQHDATQAFPHKRFSKNISIVTEGYLGPPLLNLPEAKKQSEIFSLLHKINSRFFSNAKTITPFGNKVVICFPFFKSSKSSIFYPEEMIRAYESDGFKIQHQLRSLLYERKQQIVGREVVVFDRVM